MHSPSNPTEKSEPSFARTCHRLGTGLLLDRCTSGVAGIGCRKLKCVLPASGLEVSFRRQASPWLHKSHTLFCHTTTCWDRSWRTFPPARPQPHVAAFCRDPVRSLHPPAHLLKHSTSFRSLLHSPSPSRLDCSTTHHGCAFASSRIFAITFPFDFPAPSGPPLGTVRST